MYALYCIWASAGAERSFFCGLNFRITTLYLRGELTLPVRLSIYSL